ncbi:MAG TPA: beta-ketoacyl-[acyl-carrier-protein] synthase family protein, partial [Aliiroseovarius sp.]|nr:beta-ketoacyl-[acyl-carrier-protein] synthase family protein [Aliiroseovarius sp.]
MRRVVITGQGSVNALGMDVPQTLAAMRAGQGGIGPIDIPDADRLSVRIGAQVPGYRPEDHFSRKEIALYDRFTQFSLLAAGEAVAQSGLVFDGELSERSGIVMGNSGGGMTTIDDSYRQVFEARRNKVHPFTVPRLMGNAPASHISIRHGIRGPVFTVAAACASSNHAMGQALSLIRAGMVDVALTGGSESMLCFGGIKAWEGLRVMSHDTCRPFSATRSGLVQGEGAAVFVFEEYEHARARGADILAEVAGFAMTSDASDIVMPDIDGPLRAMRGALRDAGLDPERVGYVNAHGTGTRINDPMECRAIEGALGAQAARVMVSSTKAMHGHVLGGTGAIELLACIMALREDVIAPTINFEAPDPECALDVVPNTAREARV